MPEWPGLAPVASFTADPDTRAAQVADSLTDGSRSPLKDPHLALVPARRSADILAAAGNTSPFAYTVRCPIGHDWSAARVTLPNEVAKSTTRKAVPPSAGEPFVTVPVVPPAPGW